MNPLAPIAPVAVAGTVADGTVPLAQRLASGVPDQVALGARLLEVAVTLDDRDTEAAVAALFAESGRLLAEASPGVDASRAARLAVAEAALAQAGATGAGGSAARLLRALELTLIAQDQFLLAWSQRLSEGAAPDDDWGEGAGGRW